MPRGCWVVDFRIETDRLSLREWRDEDADAMHAMGLDPRVMEFLGPPASHDQARELVAGQIVNQSLFGHCFWPVERRSDGELLGFCGLNPAHWPIDAEIEIGWRLRRDAWGRGYAREAAAASLAWGWRNLDVPTIAAITVPANARSWGLMERLGMIRQRNEDFDHPDVPDGSALKRHILYRIARPDQAGASIA